MPTSAGKTRAIELVIRSAFFSARADLAVVVAPFRALCTEITHFLRGGFSGEDVHLNELSDALQVDYSELFADLLVGAVWEFPDGIAKARQIVVVTPEKLLYVLRHNPELINVLGWSSMMRATNSTAGLAVLRMNSCLRPSSDYSHSKRRAFSYLPSSRMLLPSANG